MIKLGVIYSIFKIRLGDSQGTAFTVEHADRQYFVTARHVLPGMTERATVDIWHEERWKSMDVTVVGMGDGEVDVTVLSATSQVSPLHALGMSVGGIIYSQPVYLLGFPLGLHSGGAEVNRGLPIPFVKSGIVSALESGGVQRIYVDTHANEGFSGGPVVFAPASDSTTADDLRVAGVVTGYVEHRRPMQDADGRHMADAGENTGIAVAVGVKHVIDLIDANPIGFEVRTGG